MKIKPVYLQYLLICAMLGVTVSLIFLPELYIIRISEEFLVQIMLAFLGAGFFFLLFNNRNLILTSFLCCGLLCLFLKKASNENLSFSKATEGEKVSVAHINLSDINEAPESLISQLKEFESDLVSLHGFTPVWEKIILNEFSDTYPYSISYPSLDPNGKCILSKYYISYTDTFHIDSIPNLLGSFELENGQTFFLLSSQLTPPRKDQSTDKLNAQLKHITEIITDLDDPVIIAGKFNQVYWSSEIRSFRNETKLLNSRREARNAGMKVSYDHIFHTPDLECINFNEIRHQNGLWGMSGTFQWTKNVASELIDKTKENGL